MNKKASLKIHEIAEDYLSNDPTAWLKFSKALTSKISQWAVRTIDDAGGLVTEVEMEDTILPELLSPTLISLISQGLDHQSIIEEISRLADEIISTAQAGFDFKPFRTSDPDDLNSWLGDDKPFDDKAGYGVAELSFNRYELEDTIADFLSDGKITDIVAAPNLQSSENLIFSLDNIDPRLYKLLLDNPELLRTLEWRTFEKLLADALEALGFEVELQKGTKDGGIDLFAIKRQATMGPQRFLIQAKRYKNNVGVEPVQRLMFLHQHHHVTKACLATTSTFTGGAWRLAEQYKWQLELKDFDGVLEWVRQAAKQRLSL